jgi:hypothetical protein
MHFLLDFVSIALITLTIRLIYLRRLDSNGTGRWNRSSIKLVSDPEPPDDVPAHAKAPPNTPTEPPMTESQASESNDSTTTRITDLENTLSSLLLFLNNLTAADGEPLLGLTHNMSDYLSAVIKLQRKAQANITSLQQRIQRLEEEMGQWDERVDGMGWAIRDSKETLAELATKFEMEKLESEKQFRMLKDLLEKTVGAVEEGRSQRVVDDGG